MRKLKGHLTYANVVATLALIVAVAGGSTAIAISAKVKKNSVGTKQIKKGSITAAKIADGNVTSSKLAPIRVVRTVGSATSAEASCTGAGERLLGGGGSATNGSLVTSTAPGGTIATWRASGVTSTSVEAIALCLSTAPGS